MSLFLSRWTYLTIDCQRHPSFDPWLQKDDPHTAGDSFQGPCVWPRARLHYAESQHDSGLSRIVYKRVLFWGFVEFNSEVESNFTVEAFSLFVSCELRGCNILYITMVWWVTTWYSCSIFTFESEDSWSCIHREMTEPVSLKALANWTDFKTHGESRSKSLFPR